MEYVARAPVPALAPIVDDLYFLAGTPPYPRLTIPPMPSALLVINLAAPFRVSHAGGSEDFADGCAWATPTCPTTFEYPPNTRSVGVHLKPWGLVPHDQVGPLFDWLGASDTPLYAHSRDYYRPMLDPTLVVGRHVFDMTGGWGAEPPAGDHCVVVSHRPAPEGWDPATPFHFVDDAADAVRLARQLAGERTVSIAAGDVGGQIFAAGLVDKVALDVEPVVFGRGKRFVGPLSALVVLEDPDEVVQGDRVLHLRFRVRG